MFRRTVMLTVTSLLLISGISVWCAGKINEKKNNVSVTSTVTEDTKFHHAKLAMNEEQFEEYGFELGDSVDVKFANGYEMTDVPYYSGYFVKCGEPIVVAYPGYDKVNIGYNNEALWPEASLEENEEVTITINKKHKYEAIQNTLGMGYDPDRRYYSSDEVFSNFRAIETSHVKDNLIYRGASPVDNTHNRASITNELISKAGIKYVVNLADSAEDIEKYTKAPRFNSEYYMDLLKNNNVSLLDMDAAYTSINYQQKVVEGFRAMMKSEGPVYIHCQEGKDRTGFVAFLLEALAGDSYDEMKNDYMITYDNYYHVSAEKTPEKYEAVSNLYFEAFAIYLHGTKDHNELVSASYKEDAVKYLLTGGMTMDEITALQNFITK